MTKILVDKAVIEQALETLRMYEPSVVKFGLTFKHGQDAIAALHAALDQPIKQKPVAWMHPHKPDIIQLSQQDGWFPLYLSK